MFGMGFMEILLIAVIAVIALGPDKLPTAMVEIAKFIKKLKSGVEDAKSTLDNELNITEMKAEAAKFKAQIENVKSSVNIKENMDLGLDNILNEDEKKSNKESKEESPKKEKLSLKKEKKKKKKKTEVQNETKVEEKVETKIEPKEETQADIMNKFKVDFTELEDEK